MKTYHLHIVYCMDHDHVAVYINDVLIYQNDLDPESAILIAKHLNWKITREDIDWDEYEKRYC